MSESSNSSTKPCVRITCSCGHQVFEHNTDECVACPCNKGETEVLIEMLEKLALAAQFSASVIKNQGMYDLSERMAFEKLNQALAGIEIVEMETA